MQADMAAAQEALATGGRGQRGRRHGQGRRHGRGRARTVSIAADVVDPDDIEMLEDLVVAAVAEALRAPQELPVEQLGRRSPAGSTSAPSASVSRP